MERKGIYDKQQISKLHTALCNALHLKRIGENFYGIKTF